jgi:chromosome segregation protein
VIQGFKSYRDKERIDFAPETSLLTTVVGANGSGKSAITDALLFALGATGAHIRAQNQAQVINDELLKADPNAKASVEVSCVSADHAIHVRREVGTSAGRYQVREDQAGWRTCSKAEIHALLLSQLGIDITLCERFIIQQSKTVAIASSNPLGLLEFCERICGTKSLSEEIAALREQLGTLSQALAELRSSADALDQRGVENAPAVALFRRYMAKQAAWNVTQVVTTSKQVSLARYQLGPLRNLWMHAALRLSAVVREEAVAQELVVSERKTHGDLHKKVTSTQKKLATSKVSFFESQAAVAALDIEARAVASSAAKKQKLISTTAKKLVESETASSTNLQRVTRLERESSSSTGTEVPDSADQLKLKAQLKSTLKLIQEADDGAARIAADTQLATTQAARFRADLLRAQANSKSQEMAEAQCSALSAEMERNQFQLSHKSQNLNSQAQQLGLLEQQVEQQTAQQRISGLRQAVAGARQAVPVSGAALLCDLVSTTHAKYAAAVTAVVGSAARSVIVTNRPAALEVARHFRQNALGPVHCKILDEYSNRAPSAALAHDPKCVPAMTVLKWSDRRLLPVVAESFARWYIVPSAAAVPSAGVQQRDRNYVTEQGELFFGSGEIRGTAGSLRRQSPSGGDSYAIRSQVDMRDLGCEEAQAPQATQRQLRELQQALSDAEAKVKRSRSELELLQQAAERNRKDFIVLHQRVLKHTAEAASTAISREAIEAAAEVTRKRLQRLEEDATRNEQSRATAVARHALILEQHHEPAEQTRKHEVQELLKTEQATARRLLKQKGALKQKGIMLKESVKELNAKAATIASKLSATKNKLEVLKTSKGGTEQVLADHKHSIVASAAALAEYLHSHVAAKSQLSAGRLNRNRTEQGYRAKLSMLQQLQEQGNPVHQELDENDPWIVQLSEHAAPHDDAMDVDLESIPKPTSSDSADDDQALTQLAKSQESIDDALAELERGSWELERSRSKINMQALADEKERLASVVEVQSKVLVTSKDIEAARSKKDFTEQRRFTIFVRSMNQVTIAHFACHLYYLTAISEG